MHFTPQFKLITFQMIDKPCTEYLKCWQDPLEKGMMATYSNILAWRIPWTDDPGGLQSMGSQKAGHD